MVVRPSPLAPNYDPDVFPDPLRFDIHRKPKRILSFGAGPHHCIGNILGRTTITIAITRAAGAVPGRASDRSGLHPGLRRRGRRTAPAKPADDRAMSRLVASPRGLDRRHAGRGRRRGCATLGRRPGGLPEPGHPHRRALRAGRRARYGRPLPGAAAAGPGRPVGRGREPRRRQWQRRGRRDHLGAGGWLYADGYRQRDAVGQSHVPHPAVLQPAEGFRPGRAAGARADLSRRAFGRAGRDAAGVHRLREGAARPGQLRLVGRRQHAPSHHGGDEVGAAPADDPHSLSRHRPVGAGAARRSRAGAVLGLSVAQGRGRDQPRQITRHQRRAALAARPRACRRWPRSFRAST